LDDWGDAKAEWALDKRQWEKDKRQWEQEQKLIKQQQAEQQRTQQQRAAQIEAEYNEKKLSAQDNPEWMEHVVENPELKVGDMLGMLVTQCENYIDVGVWLGKNPKEAARIDKLSPGGMLRELGKIEAKVEIAKSNPETKIKNEPTKVTRPGASQPMARSEVKKLLKDARPGNLDDYANVVAKLGI
jgi:hypothetical protein